MIERLSLYTKRVGAMKNERLDNIVESLLSRIKVVFYVSKLWNDMAFTL